MKNVKKIATLVLLLMVIVAQAAQSVRIKDVTTLSGVEELQLFGYGLVVGLAETGDRQNTVFTNQTIRNMLKNMGVELPAKQIILRNVAAVMVTGTLSPFKKRGTKLDITASSIGDARSLEGGTLIMTPLQGPDGKLYATAQGSLATGGVDVRNGSNNRYRKNHILVGRVPNGAIVQNEYKFNEFNGVDLAVSLNKPDFTSAVSMATAINGNMVAQFGFTKKIAKSIDASTVTLDFASAQEQIAGAGLELAEFISYVENVEFTVSMPARVVMNERTGTIVAGSNVKISEVALTHGNVKVEITNSPQVVSPQPFTLGDPLIIPNGDLMVEEGGMDMVVLDESTTVSDLSSALNSLGVTSRDIITIFQAIKEAGALQGQLIIM
jgi:flagellar P-ring protein precursor FlgI